MNFNYLRCGYSKMSDEKEVEDLELQRHLDFLDLQSMIDISADRLEGLRTQIATSAKFIQQEIRAVESKLIKLFSKQLLFKQTLKEDLIDDEIRNLPELRQWLQVVGLSEDTVTELALKISSLESLREKSQHELKAMLVDLKTREEEVRRLVTALNNLQRYTVILQKGGKIKRSLKLYWDSWDGDKGNTTDLFNLGTPNVKGTASGEECKDVTTLSSQNNPQTSPSLTVTLNSGCASSIKSKSCESQLSNTEGDQMEKGDSLYVLTRKSSLAKERKQACIYASDCNSSIVFSSIKSPADSLARNCDNNSYKSLRVPEASHIQARSPEAHVRQILHRFTKTNKKTRSCDFCERLVFIGTGLKCKKCKYNCHRDCASKVSVSCELPQKILDGSSQAKTLSIPGRTSKLPLKQRYRDRIRKPSHPQPSIYSLFFYLFVPPYPDSDSNSTDSCNSSILTNPALVRHPLRPQNREQGQVRHPDKTSKSGEPPKKITKSVEVLQESKEEADVQKENTDKETLRNKRYRTIQLNRLRSFIRRRILLPPPPKFNQNEDLHNPGTLTPPVPSSSSSSPSPSSQTTIACEAVNK